MSESDSRARGGRPATGAAHADAPVEPRSRPAETAAADSAADVGVAGAPADASGDPAGPPLGSGPAPRGRWPRTRLWWTPLVLVVVLGLLAAGAALDNLVSRPPAEGSADVGFARDMSEHHAQAVQMGMIEFARGGDQDTRKVAQDIALTQQREVGVMSSWLSGWGRAQTATGAPMLWMGGGHATGDHDDHGDHGQTDVTDMPGMSATDPRETTESGAADPRDTARMPGMATPAELERLASIQGRDLDVLFLTLMVRHHRGGVAMAQYAALHAGEDKVRALARAMVVAQSAEIDQMQRDLVRLGAPRA